MDEKQLLALLAVRGGGFQHSSLTGETFINGQRYSDDKIIYKMVDALEDNGLVETWADGYCSFSARITPLGRKEVRG